MLVDPNNYIDNKQLPILSSLIEEFVKQDVSKYWIDVGEKNVGVSINWKSIIMYDTTNNYQVSDELKLAIPNIVDYATTMPGLHRITVNFLTGFSFMPIHTDTDYLPDYDTSSTNYNIILPITDFGQSIVDYRVIKNKKGDALIFDGQVPHGAINDTTGTRITIYLLVDKTRFTNDSTER